MSDAMSVVCPAMQEIMPMRMGSVAVMDDSVPSVHCGESLEEFGAAEKPHDESFHAGDLYIITSLNPLRQSLLQFGLSFEFSVEEKTGFFQQNRIKSFAIQMKNR
jgi:hypothetical protein